MHKERKEVDLSALPYKHRAAAANILLAKATNLADKIGGIFIDEIDEADVNKARQVISYYDIALQLMKPYHGDYCSIIHKKCILLVALKQYKEASEWYKELIRLEAESDGSNFRDRTAKRAQISLKKYKGKKNASLPELDDKFDKILDHPAYCWSANQFCDALENRKFKFAHEHLSEEYGATVSSNQLKKDWLSFLDDSNADVHVVLNKYSSRSAKDNDEYLGRCYFTVIGKGINKEVAVEVFQDGEQAFKIRKVEFAK